MHRIHRDIRTTIIFPDHYSHFGYCYLGITPEQFCSMPNNPFPLLMSSGQVAGNIDECNKWNIEGIAESDKTSCFIRGIDIQTTGQNHGLIGYDSYSSPIQASQTDDNIFSIIFMWLKKVTIIQNFMNNLF